MEEEHEMSTLRATRKKSSVGISCCFTGINQHHHRRRASFDAATSSSSTIPLPSPRRSPSTWIKSKANDFPEIKGKCRNFISRMSRHRRHSSAEFSYDPLSYALNFDEDGPSGVDEFRSMNFTARLPASPPMRTTKTTPFDQHLPRTAIRRSPPDAYYTPAAEGGRTKLAARSDELRKGFEALSVSMKRISVKEPSAALKVAEQRRNKTELSSPRAAAVAEVRRSLEVEEVTSPVGISSNLEILV